MAGEKILMIDDDPDVIEATKVVLESKGYQMFSAMSKQEGVARIEEITPDLIILDVMMEKMSDGFDLARKLKSNDKYKKIPILMLTAVGKVMGFKFSAEAGDKVWLPVDDYCEKPLSYTQLITKIDRLLHPPG